MRAFLLSTLFFALSIVAFSQEEFCGTFVPEGAPDPNRNINLRESQSRISSALLNNSAVITIPVVFHILHLGEEIGQGSNVSNEDILAVLSTTNDLFRSTEASGNLNDPLAVDTKIQFELATVDPNGLPVTGITRQDLSDWPLFESKGIHYDDDFPGAQGVQDTYHYSTHPEYNHGYINIWVTHLIGGYGGLQGFAYTEPYEGHPLTPGHRDGVVIRSSKICGGLECTTLAHEIGHYLNLSHTFENTEDCTESNCVTQGDGVCDTPVQLINPSCNEIPQCYSDDNRNVMGYGHGCRRRFTAGQADRIKLRGIAFFRPWIIENSDISLGYDYDLAVYTPSYDDRMQSCREQLRSYFVIKNVGNNTINSFYIILNDNLGNQLGFEFINESLEPGDDYIHNFIFPNTPGIESISLNTVPFSSNENDQYLNNNEAVSNVIQLPNSKELVITQRHGLVPNVVSQIVRPPYEWYLYPNTNAGRFIVKDWRAYAWGVNGESNASNATITRSTCVPADSCYSVNIYYDPSEDFGQPSNFDYSTENGPCIEISLDGEMSFQRDGAACSGDSLSAITVQVFNGPASAPFSKGYYAIRHTVCNGVYSPSNCDDIDEDGICDPLDPCIGSYDACGVCNGPGAVYECGCSDIQAGNCGCCGLIEDAIGICGGTCQTDINGDGICDD